MAVLVVVAAGVALAACTGATPPVPGNPELTFTVDKAVAQADSIHGMVVATGDRDLIELEVTVTDTAGTDSTTQLVGGGTSNPASKLTDKFAYKVMHVQPGGYVRFSAIAFDYFGDSTIVRDSTLVNP
jgi:hypothetical protein